MRLTLRTMLAYMDNILEPADAEEIGKRIEESDLATNLLHRTRDVMRRLRLGAPSVMDRGVGLDPNTVAEYLDNTLAKDRVPDFEKVCLESDVHLAEVASCHQILALVLGEPAEVDMSSRQRMYRLPEFARTQLKESTEATDKSGAGTDVESTMRGMEARGEPTSRPERPKADVPEWLRQQRTSRRRWRVVAAAAVVLLCVVLLAITGQFRSDSLLANLLGLGQPQTPTVQAPKPDDTFLPPQRGPSDTGTQTSEAKTEVPQKPAREVPPVAAPTDKVAGPEGQTEPAPSGEGTAPQEAEQVEVAPEGPTEPLPTTTPGAAEPAAPSPESPPLVQPPVADVPMTQPEKPEPSGVQAQSEAKVPVAAAPLPPEPVGQLDSPMQVLLTFDDDAGTWRRLPQQAPIMPQTRYSSLPTYRPVIRLGGQMQLRLIDNTQIQFLPVGPEGVLGVVVEYGRLAVENQKEGGAPLRLQVGDRCGTVTLADLGSGLAIEVGRTPASGADPETQPAPLTADLYVTSGKALWQEDEEDNSVVLDAPVQLRLDQRPLEAVAAPSFPNWIVAHTISLLDQRASATIERVLDVGRAVNLGLRELAEHRQREVRWLALRCLDCIGDFELMVAALDDPDERWAWRDCVAELRSAVHRSPSVAAQVRNAMERLHGREGASLYEMLWKFGGESLDAEGADQLVRYLDHNTLAFRVVSFETLTQITGLGLLYRPEYTSARRQPFIQRWKERLRSAPLTRAETEGETEAAAAPADSPGDGPPPGSEN